MKYVSTRGQSRPSNFLDILLKGMAADGGLYLPSYYPDVDRKTLHSWSKLSYGDLAFEILSLYIDDIPKEDLRIIIDSVYTKEIFGTDEITPVQELYPGLFLQGLSNGPTRAFKDIALQLLGKLFEYELARRGEELNILGATSGDTGSSAEYAMLGKKGIRVFMLSPSGRMSPFQEAQMYSINNPNVYNIAINGVFDDCQDIVKAVSGDYEFKSNYKIGTVNSINWARILAQIVYYFYGYSRAVKENYVGIQKISFAVPTGNFGNICAGHIARMMGLPIEHLILATNENDVLYEFFQTGHYSVRDETIPTSSPSMDITKASNFERFIFDLLGSDGVRVQKLFRSKKGFKLSKEEFHSIKMFGFLSGQSCHKDRLNAIRHIWEAYSVMVDTHTADAIKVAIDYSFLNSTPVIVLETAKAIKFADTIYEAISLEPERPNKFKGIEDLPKYFNVMEPDVNLVKEFIRNHC